MYHQAKIRKCCDLYGILHYSSPHLNYILHKKVCHNMQLVPLFPSSLEKKNEHNRKRMLALIISAFLQNKTNNSPTLKSLGCKMDTNAPHSIL